MKKPICLLARGTSQDQQISGILRTSELFIHVQKLGASLACDTSF